jgi:hypothetical protein
MCWPHNRGELLHMLQEFARLRREILLLHLARSFLCFPGSFETTTFQFGMPDTCPTLNQWLRLCPHRAFNLKKYPLVCTSNFRCCSSGDINWWLHIICWSAACNMQSLFAIRLLMRFSLFLLSDWLFFEYHVSIRNFCFCKTFVVVFCVCDFICQANFCAKCWNSRLYIAV